MSGKSRLEKRFTKVLDTCPQALPSFAGLSPAMQESIKLPEVTIVWKRNDDDDDDDDDGGGDDDDDDDDDDDGDGGGDDGDDGDGGGWRRCGGSGGSDGSPKDGGPWITNFSYQAFC